MICSRFRPPPPPPLQPPVPHRLNSRWCGTASPQPTCTYRSPKRSLSNTTKFCRLWTHCAFTSNRSPPPLPLLLLPLPLPVQVLQSVCCAALSFTPMNSARARLWRCRLHRPLPLRTIEMGTTLPCNSSLAQMQRSLNFRCPLIMRSVATFDRCVSYGLYNLLLFVCVCVVQNPQPHITFAWCLGDIFARYRQHIARSSSSTSAASAASSSSSSAYLTNPHLAHASEPLSLAADRSTRSHFVAPLTVVHCKVGNQLYTFPLTS